MILQSLAAREDDPQEAIKLLQAVKESGEDDWPFKATKQLVKTYCSTRRFDEARSEFDHFLALTSTKSKNYAEKSTNSLLDHIADTEDSELTTTLFAKTLINLESAKNDVR